MILVTLNCLGHQGENATGSLAGLLYLLNQNRLETLNEMEMMTHTDLRSVYIYSLVTVTERPSMTLVA
jgi:hypothetical protein